MLPINIFPLYLYYYQKIIRNIYTVFFLLVLGFHIDLVSFLCLYFSIVYSKSFIFLWLFYLWLNSFGLQGKDKTPEERRIAICIFDDVAEQCREAALK